MVAKAGSLTRRNCNGPGMRVQGPVLEAVYSRQRSAGKNLHAQLNAATWTEKGSWSFRVSPWLLAVDEL